MFDLKIFLQDLINNTANLLYNDSAQLLPFSFQGNLSDFLTFTQSFFQNSFCAIITNSSAVSPSFNGTDVNVNVSNIIVNNQLLFVGTINNVIVDGVVSVNGFYNFSLAQ